MINPKLEAARIEVERSRAQFIETAKELQARLQPKTLARDAWESAKDKGADLAEEAVDAVRKRPYAASGIVAALALFIAREPLKDLFGRLSDAMTSDDGDDDRSSQAKGSDDGRQAAAEPEPRKRRDARRARARDPQV